MALFICWSRFNIKSLSFHKPSGRLTSCISPDGLAYQPLTSMAPHLHDKSWSAVIRRFCTGRMPQLMALRASSPLPTSFLKVDTGYDFHQCWSVLRHRRIGSNCIYPPASYFTVFLQFLFLSHLSLSTPWSILLLLTLYRERAFSFLLLLFSYINHWKMYIKASENSYTVFGSGVGGADNILLNLACSLFIFCNKEFNCLCQFIE